MQCRARCVRTLLVATAMSMRRCWFCSGYRYTFNCVSGFAASHYPDRIQKARVKLSVQSNHPFQSSSNLLGSDVVHAPLQSKFETKVQDPYNCESREYVDFVQFCADNFRRNGWVHVPSYLQPEETRNLLSEAERVLYHVRKSILKL